MDREKVITDIEQQIRWIEEIECHKFPGWLNVTNAMRDAIALLKEQEDLGTELTNAVELIHKKNERIEKLLKEQKFLVDSDGKITPLPVVVRCKDCKHRPIKPNDYENGFDLEFPDGKCPCQCDDGWYSWYPPDDWFCAEGERKDI